MPQVAQERQEEALQRTLIFSDDYPNGNPTRQVTSDGVLSCHTHPTDTPKAGGPYQEYDPPGWEYEKGTIFDVSDAARKWTAASTP